jgi:hypothetical protein
MSARWNFSGTTRAQATDLSAPAAGGKSNEQLKGYGARGKPGPKRLVRSIVCASCVTGNDTRLGQSWQKRTCARCKTECEPGIVVQTPS